MRIMTFIDVDIYHRMALHMLKKVLRILDKVSRSIFLNVSISETVRANEITLGDVDVSHRIAYDYKCCIR